MPRAHRELVFSSRSRRHAAQQISGKATDHIQWSSLKPPSARRALLLPRPRWRRGRDTQPNRQLAREEMGVGSCEKGARRAAGALRAKPFFLLTRLDRPQYGAEAPASLPTGVNCIPFRRNIWAPQPKVPAAISVEKTVSSEGHCASPSKPFFAILRAA